jgi:group I intron endonuclease
MGYIYVLTNKVNGKKYIGQSQQADIKNRWSAYRAMKKNSIGTVLLNALKKNGIDNFKFQIICICFDEDCNQYEKDYIKKYNTIKPNGYNMQDGGKNPSITCRKKIVLTDEQKEKMKGRNKGEKHPCFGKPMSEEQKKKISESRRNFEANKDTSYKKRKCSAVNRREEQYINTMRITTSLGHLHLFQKQQKL